MNVPCNIKYKYKYKIKQKSKFCGNMIIETVVQRDVSFSFFLKVSMVGESWIWEGRLFQRSGAQAEKARSP